MLWVRVWVSVFVDVFLGFVELGCECGWLCVGVLVYVEILCEYFVIVGIDQVQVVMVVYYVLQGYIEFVFWM